MTIDTIFHGPTDQSTPTIGDDVTSSNFPAVTPVTIASPEPGSPNRERIAERVADSGGSWIACCEQSGVIEIRDPRLLRPGKEAFCVSLVESAITRFEVQRAEVHIDSAICRLEFGPGRFNRRELAQRVTGAVRAATSSVRDGSAVRDGFSSGWTILTGFSADGQALLSATRVDSGVASESALTAAVTSEASGRLTNLIMAGGSLALAVGGIILPAIPVLPFLIMSARYAAKARPIVEHVLMRKRWCASLLARTDNPAAAQDCRWSLPMIGLAAIAAVALLIFHPPYPVVLGLELALTCVFGSHELVGPRCLEIAGGCVA